MQMIKSPCHAMHPNTCTMKIIIIAIYIYNYVVSAGTGVTVTSNVTSNVASLDENVMLTYVDGGGGPSTFQWEFDGV